MVAALTCFTATTLAERAFDASAYSATMTAAEFIPRQRLATGADAARIGVLMRSSVLELFPSFYDDRQTASAAVHIARVDARLIADGTYFVHEADGEIVACGGWSRRGRLYTGSGAEPDDDRLLDPRSEAAHIRAMFVRGHWTRRGLGRALLEAGRAAAAAEGFRSLDLMATLPGVPLYRAFGFAERKRVVLTMGDGVAINAVVMDRTVDG
jgi:GNAT superfamily N-acetyltransferase